MKIENKKDIQILQNRNTWKNILIEFVRKQFPTANERNFNGPKMRNSGI